MGQALPHSSRLTGGPPIEIDPRLNRRMIRRVFDAHGRVHIGGVLIDEAARALHRSLTEEVPWSLVFNDGDKVYDLEGEHIDAMPPENKIGLANYIDSKAHTHFQYVYNTFRIDKAAEDAKLKDLYVLRLADFLNTPPFLDFVREATGLEDIAFADAQATMYRPGHFLARHNDDVDGKNRLAAYVLNLTPVWRAEWGGLLLFLDAHGHVAEGYVPAFNALNIFRVPQEHLVSYVAPYAGGPRLSVTGWLRAR